MSHEERYRVDPEHKAALAQCGKHQERVEYACKVMPAADLQTANVEAWLVAHGWKIPRPKVSKWLNEWRRANGVALTGEMAALTPEHLAELDRIRAANPTDFNDAVTPAAESVTPTTVTPAGGNTEPATVAAVTPQRGNTASAADTSSLTVTPRRGDTTEASTPVTSRGNSHPAVTVPAPTRPPEPPFGTDPGGEGDTVIPPPADNNPAEGDTAEVPRSGAEDEAPESVPAVSTPPPAAPAATPRPSVIAGGRHHRRNTMTPPVIAPVVTDNSDRDTSSRDSDNRGNTTGETAKRAAEHVRHPRVLLGIFYGAVATIALWGQSDGMIRWLDLASSGLPDWGQRLVAVGAGGFIEFLAAVLLVFADWRSIEKDERAYFVRTLAVTVAGFIVFLNWAAHDGMTQYAFAGISAIGFAVFVLHSNARRRDAQRAKRRAAAPAQQYPVLQWALHPVMTWRASQAAKRNPKLGLYGSLDHVYAERRAATQRAALEGLTRRLLSAKYGVDGHTDPNTIAKLKVEIEATRYNMDKVAGELASGADNSAMAASIGAVLLGDSHGALAPVTPEGRNAVTPEGVTPEPRGGDAVTPETESVTGNNSYTVTRSTVTP